MIKDRAGAIEKGAIGGTSMSWGPARWKGGKPRRELRNGLHIAHNTQTNEKTGRAHAFDTELPA